jgi:FkbM family methyltransferase
MLVSCLTITQPGRLDRLCQAVGDFFRQTYARKEMVIVHDGDADFDANLRALCTATERGLIRISAMPPGTKLGALRNQSVDLARGELVCQWDDDDRHHPERIQLQVDALMADKADFCFLVDQLHWFPGRRELTWDDWNGEAYPFNFIPGTLLGYRNKMPSYPPRERGEDTQLCTDIIQREWRIVRLRDVGWCYVYVFHGGNAWSMQHHRAISQHKSLRAARLLGREAVLRRRLAEYDPPLGALVMPSSCGNIEIGLPEPTRKEAFFAASTGLDLHYRTNSRDLAIFDSVVSGEYGKHDLSGKVVVDVGAHIGSFSLHAAQRGALRVLAYETASDNYRLLVENCRGLANVECHHAAVWRSDRPNGSVTWRPSANASNTGGGSVIACQVIAVGPGPTADPQDVATIAFDDIVAQLGHIDLLKIDAEGSEYPILLTSKRLDSVQEIVGEYHEVVGPNADMAIPGFPNWDIRSLRAHLERAGFSVAINEKGHVGLFRAVRPPR